MVRPKTCLWHEKHAYGMTKWQGSCEIEFTGQLFDILHLVWGWDSGLQGVTKRWLLGIDEASHISTSLTLADIADSIPQGSMRLQWCAE
jgi:hypothetical protein